MYVLLAEFCPTLVYYGLCEPGLANLLEDPDGLNCS